MAWQAKVNELSDALIKFQVNHDQARRALRDFADVIKPQLDTLYDMELEETGSAPGYQLNPNGVELPNSVARGAVALNRFTVLRKQAANSDD